MAFWTWSSRRTTRRATAWRELMRRAERWVMLNVIDNLWVQHLTSIDDLREGIGLRAYGQRARWWSTRLKHNMFRA